jgi:hypothetical protein
MPDTASFNETMREGPVARTIEHETAKVPSDVFLWAALGTMGVSALLQGARAKHTSLFVGQWVPVFLMFGLYNKIVKIHGSDAHDLQNPQHQGQKPFQGTGQRQAQGQQQPGQQPQGQQQGTHPQGQQQHQPQPARR